MKKTILATAIALASSGAFATCGGGGCANANLPSNAYTTARVGGNTYMAGSNGQNAGINMQSISTAGSYTASGAKAGAAEYCGNGIGAAGSGSLAIGYAGSVSHGTQYGGAQGTNGGFASFDASTSGGQSADSDNIDVGAHSDASVSGSAGTKVTGNGFSAAGTLAGAGAAAGVAGSTEYDYNKDVDMNGWFRGHTTKTETEQADMKLGAISGAGSISGAYSVGDATGSAGSGANAHADANGSFVSRNGKATVDGGVGSGSGAGSQAINNGLAGAGTYNGAVGEASAYNSVTNEYDWKLTWQGVNRYNRSESEYTNVTASDKKFGQGDSFVIGNGSAGFVGGAGINVGGTSGDDMPED